MSIIESQRHLFDMPDDVAYLNCGYMSPLMHSVREAGYRGIDGKAQPWTVAIDQFFDPPDTCRELFGRLAGCAASSVAFVPGASYGLAAAARNLPLRRGQQVIVLEDQFPANVYVWRTKAAEVGATVRTVTRAAAAVDGGYDWTPAILEAITDSTAIVALAHCHWTDGALIDLEVVAERARSVGAALVLDVTQSLGAWPLDIGTIRPDFLVCAGYKWLLAPYTIGFLYVDEKWHDGEPLEQTWLGRGGSEDFAALVDYRDDYQPGAVRFDMAARASFHLMPMAIAALEQLLAWGVDNIAETLSARTAGISNRVVELGLEVGPAQLRAGHFVGVRFPDGLPDGLLDQLQAQRIYVSMRGDSMRITPHLYNTDADVDRLVEALSAALR